MYSILQERFSFRVESTALLILARSNISFDTILVRWKSMQASPSVHRPTQKRLIRIKQTMIHQQPCSTLRATILYNSSGCRSSPIRTTKQGRKRSRGFPQPYKLNARAVPVVGVVLVGERGEHNQSLIADHHQDAAAHVVE